jgi:MFS family permease
MPSQPTLDAAAPVEAADPVEATGHLQTADGRHRHRHRHRHRRGLAGRLGPRAGFALQTSMIVSFLAASTAPTPLYAVYQQAWGFTPVTITMIFGVYAVAVLCSLLVVGALSDHIGRRPVLLVAAALQTIAMIVFATAGGVGALMAARITQGLATGAATGALGAGLLDLHRTRGTLAGGAGPFAGMALGALGSSLLVAYLPNPTRLVYLVLLVILLAQAGGVALMGETSPRVPGARASLRPRIGLPGPVARALVVAGPCMVAAWALGGFYFSLGPSLARLVAGSHWIVLGGLALLCLAATAALTIIVVRNAPPQSVMFLGTLGLLVGVGVTLLAVATRSTAVFFTGTTLAGIGLGAGFQGGLRTLLPLADAHERAGVLSTVYVLCYLALGLPAVIAGALVTSSGLSRTSTEFGVVIMALAAFALTGLLARTRTPVAVAAVAAVAGD